MKTPPGRGNGGGVRERVNELESALAAARAELTTLEAERDRLRTIVDTIPYPIFAKTSDLRYSVCNPAFERYLGKTAAELLGKTVYDIADKDKADVYHAADLDLLASGGTQAYEGKVRYHDGSDHDVIFHKAVLPDGRGGVDGMYGFIYDITALRHADAERAKLEAQLQHAQKLQSVGRLAGGVAHDLNNLLTPILGYTTMLIASAAPEDPSCAQLEAVRRAAERARDLVRQLLALGRRQVLQLRLFDLRTLVASFADIVRRTTREDIHVDISLADEPLLVRADAGQIEQVLMNLVVNAQDAMPEGGVLRVTVREVLLDDAYAARHLGVTAGPHAMLEVSDTGCGMTAQTLERIFEPFFTTKDVDKGTGLGLPTAEGIVRQHHGHISAYSEEGIGSTFKIFLPVAASSAIADAAPDAEPLDTPLGTETILVVDDDAGVGTLACNVLKALGYRVLHAGTVESAFDIVEVQGAKVELLLTDVVLPVANGKQLFDRLKQSLPSLRVVYMSGYDRNVISHHGVLEEGICFIQKPFAGPALARKVRVALDQRR